MIVECILTFLLITAIFGTAVDTRGQAVKIGAFGIGLAVTFVYDRAILEKRAS